MTNNNATRTLHFHLHHRVFTTNPTHPVNTKNPQPFISTPKPSAMSSRFFNWARDEPPTHPLTPFQLSRLVDAAIQRLTSEGALPRPGAFTLADLYNTYDDLRDCEVSVLLGLPADCAEATFHARIAAECRRRCERLQADMDRVRAQREEMGRTGARQVGEARRVMAEVIRGEAEERARWEAREEAEEEAGRAGTGVRAAAGGGAGGSVWQAILREREAEEEREQRREDSEVVLEGVFVREVVDEERDARAAADLMRFSMRMDALLRLADQRQAMRDQRREWR
ncbi:hypothetical protein QBC39DRAFT_402285 [Podospora conica]|nr:hypothetical protein QBC39DRAFT_402285 [Schizothecium conicum]